MINLTIFFISLSMLAVLVSLQSLELRDTKKRLEKTNNELKAMVEYVHNLTSKLANNLREEGHYDPGSKTIR